MDTSTQGGGANAGVIAGLHLDVSPEKVVLRLDAGCNLSKDTLLNGLQQAGVTTGIDDAAISEAVGLSQQGQAVIDNIVARQIDPEPAKPARIEAVVSMGQAVMPGDVIQRLLPGDMGKNGTSVTGDVIEAPAAPVVKLQGGDNTQEADYEVLAARYGVVKLQGGLTHVVPPLHVSHDKLSAAIDIYPHSQQGTPISEEVILECLSDFGIVHGIDREAIADAIAEAQALQNVMARAEVAKGTPAQAAKPADFEFFFTINGEDPRKIFSGEISEADLEQPRLLELIEEDAVLCREHPATAAIPGQNIYGQEIRVPPVSGSKITKPVCGDNVIKEENEYKATVVQYGYADVRDGKLSVYSPVSLSDDKMQATLCIYPPTTDRTTLNLKSIEQMLSLQGITFGIDNAAIEQALQSLRVDGARQVCEVIGRGQEECPGDDAWFEHFVSVEKQAGAKKEDGTMDFRERGTIINLQPGDAIGKKTPPTAGQPQVNLLGETTLAKGGKDIDFRAGEHCELRDDGVFYATDEGALLIKDDLVHVTDIYRHEGDVDLQSGNLFHKKGAIEVSGSVMSGFHVKANGHVIVKENVDNGKITAGGDVVVGAGAIQPEEGSGHIHAMGSVTVKFAQNARILSYRDISVGGSAMNCQLHAKGKINVTKGKGCIIGGIAKSALEVRAKQLGSEAGSLTQVEIEIDPMVRKNLAEAISREEELVATGEGDPDKLQALIREQKQLFEKSRENAAIIVEGVLYPGTTVKILNVAQAVKEERRRCKITLSSTKKLHFGNIE